MKNVRKYEIEDHLSEPGRPQQNRAESVIREVKRRCFRLMVKQKVPKRLWGFASHNTSTCLAETNFKLEDIKNGAQSCKLKLKCKFLLILATLIGWKIFEQPIRMCKMSEA